MTHPHTHKEEPRSWEERFDKEFVCVGGIDECKLPHQPYLKDNANVANLKSFIATREKEVRGIVDDELGIYGVGSAEHYALLNLRQQLTTKTEGR